MCNYHSSIGGENVDKDKMVVLWENGKQIKVKVNTSSSNLSDPRSKEEAAASVERLQDNEDIPLFQRKMPNNFNSKLNKPKRWGALKPVLLTIASALGVGTLLGIIMLRMFGTIDPEVPTNGSAAVPAEIETANEESSNAEVALEPVNAFVLQAGVFSGRENASEWAETYKEAGVSTILWEKDNQFYLLAGMAQDKEGATQLRDEMTKDGLEFYVKEWSTGAGTLHVSEDNKAWLEQLQKNWIETKKGLSNERPFEKESWDKLAQLIPKQAGQFSPLAEEVRKSAELAEDLTSQKAQHQLLLLWNLYTDSADKQ